MQTPDTAPDYCAGGGHRHAWNFARHQEHAAVGNCAKRVFERFRGLKHWLPMTIRHARHSSPMSHCCACKVYTILRRGSGTGWRAVRKEAVCTSRTNCGLNVSSSLLKWRLLYLPIAESCLPRRCRWKAWRMPWTWPMVPARDRTLGRWLPPPSLSNTGLNPSFSWPAATAIELLCRVICWARQLRACVICLSCAATIPVRETSRRRRRYSISIRGRCWKRRVGSATRANCLTAVG